MMPQEESNNFEQRSWTEKLGLLWLLRVPRLALRVDALILAMGVVLAAAVWGTVLNLMSSAGGGVDNGAIRSYVHARATGDEYILPEGNVGAFALFHQHFRDSVIGALGSVVPHSLTGGAGVGYGLGAGYGAGLGYGAGFLSYLSNAGAAFLWLLRYFPFYGLLYLVGVIFIWSIGGGAIHRMMAAQVTRNERMAIDSCLRFSVDRLFSGFMLSIVVPFVSLLLVSLLLVLGGVLLRIPLLGDLAGGLFFGLALLGGFVVAALLVGMLFAGHLFWPAVACDGADGFDAFSRAFSYVGQKPWRAVFYYAFSFVFGAIHWLIAAFLARLVLEVTRALVGFGTAPFGWWLRSTENGSLSKLDLLWPVGGLGEAYQAPARGQLGAFEYLSAPLISLWVFIFLALLWSFLVSLYSAACTTAYLLLRRDVDGTDYGDLYVDDELAEKEQSIAPTVSESASDNPVS